MGKRKMTRNAVECLACGKIIESTYRHDYNVCGCPNHAMVDGGLEDYVRYGAADMNKIRLIHEYEEDTDLPTDKEDERDSPEE